MERGGEDSRTTSPFHDLFGSIIIKPHNAQSTGAQWIRGHDVMLVQHLNVITEFRVCGMMAYQPAIKWIGFGYGGTDRHNQKE